MLLRRGFAVRSQQSVCGLQGGGGTSVRAARHTFGLDAVITRSGNNYGPRQFPEKLIPLLLANALGDRPIPIYGDGRQVRDWIYVDDHCRAILAVLTQGHPRPVYHIGADQRSNLDVALSILDQLGKPASLIRFVKDRPGHDRRYAIDPARIETELGWRPAETWESGVAKTIKWYQKISAGRNELAMALTGSSTIASTEVEAMPVTRLAKMFSVGLFPTIEPEAFHLLCPAATLRGNAKPE